MNTTMNHLSACVIVCPFIPQATEIIKHNNSLRNAHLVLNTTVKNLLRLSILSFFSSYCVHSV